MTLSRSQAMHRGPRPAVRAVVAMLTAAALPPLAGCSSMCQRHERAAQVLDEQTVLLCKLKAERADPRVSAKVAADPDLKASEVHLNLVIEMLIRSNGAVKTAL